MKNPIKLSKSFLIEPLKFYYNILTSMFSLNVKGIGDDDFAVLINEKIDTLYAVEIAGAGERTDFLPKHVINALIADHAHDELGEFVWTILKDEPLKKNLIFTQSKKIATTIASAIQSKILTFDEVMLRLLSLYFNNEYEIDWIKRELKTKIGIDFDNEYANPINTLNALIRERAINNYSKMKYYQAVSYKSGLDEDTEKFNISAFFKINFKGALFTRVIFCKETIKSELINQRLNTTGQLTNRDKNWIDALKSSVDGKPRVMLNTVLQVFDTPDDTDVSKAVEAIANCTFDTSTKYLRTFNSKTPILKRNKAFSKVVDKSFLYNYISYNSKLDSDKPHWCGLSQSDTFVNFGFKKATERHEIPKQHFTILGPSGCGKTNAANNGFAQFLGFDYKTGKMHYPDDTEHVIFDIKDSFKNVVELIHKYYPEYVSMNDFDKNTFRYNILDCEVKNIKGRKQVVETDLDFASTLVSMVLASNGDVAESLNTAESEEFKQAIKALYTGKGFTSLTLSTIRSEYPDEYKKIRALGYDEFIPLSSIKEKEFENFRKPLLHNAINILKQRKINYSLSKEGKREETISSLIHKLQTIDAMEIFSNYSKLNFEDKKIIYFRTDSIVGGNDYGYLVFAMQSILAKKKKASQNKKKLENKKPPGVQYRPLIIFWYEEARNTFENRLFRDKQVFERIIYEWRGYDMVCGAITQEAEHIPPNIIKGFEIKILLVTGEDEEERQKFLDYASEHLGIGAQRRKILEELPKYTMAVMYGDGMFTMRFQNDQEFRELINT